MAPSLLPDVVAPLVLLSDEPLLVVLLLALGVLEKVILVAETSCLPLPSCSIGSDLMNGSDLILALLGLSP